MLGIRPQFWLLAAVAAGVGVAVVLALGPTRDGREETVATRSARPAAEGTAVGETLASPPSAAAVESAPGPATGRTSAGDAPPLTAERTAFLAAMVEMNELTEVAREASEVKRRGNTPEEIEFQKRARDEAERRGVELPPELREEIDGLEPLPDEGEQEFAERREKLENEALTKELVVNVIIWRQHVNHIYRWGEPLSQYEAMARRRVARMPLTRQVAIFRSLRRMDRNNLGEPIPRFYPPDAVAPYDRPDAEAPPPNYIWAEPDS